jgi:hypothetical protein
MRIINQKFSYIICDMFSNCSVLQGVVRVVTIIDIDLIKIIETRLYASSEDPRASFGPDVSSSLQPGQRTVQFPIERRGTERSFSDEPL